MSGASGEDKPRVIMATSSGYCYSDASSNGNPNTQTHLITQLHNFDESNTGFYNLATSMEMIGFPPKNLNQPISDQNNSFLWKQHDFPGTTNETLMVSSPWNHSHNRIVVEDLSQMSVFTERPTRGLSLSLNSSSIELQSFELRRQNDELRFGSSSSGFVIRNSKYLKPAQELLYEFCNLETKQFDKTSKMNAQKNSEWCQNNLDFSELQKRKTKLIQMLQELDRRYKHYCDQMKAVVQSFEAVAGDGAATLYSGMASKAMSRHFRCLKDGIVNQIKAIKNATGEKDTGAAAAAGTSKGETPRLRLLEQKLRQERTYQQIGMIESHPWRPQRGLPERSVSVLRAWLFEHFLHPYPSDVDKHILARQTGLSRSQVSNWFINARVRLWKPMVEEMYLEDQKENENSSHPNPNPNPTQVDEKPTQDQLDSESLSSIINTPAKNIQQQHGGDHEYGAMHFDFSPYNQHSAPGGATVPYHGGGGGVTLTLA